MLIKNQTSFLFRCVDYMNETQSLSKKIYVKLSTQYGDPKDEIPEQLDQDGLQKDVSLAWTQWAV